MSTFVGNLALQQSADADSGRGDVARYWSGHTKRLLLTLAGATIRERRFTLRVVTGLPVTVWAPETKQRVQQALVGVHRFTLNGVEREATVEGVAVMMEGAGALAVVGSAEPVPQAVIDAGGRTTDLFWAEGQRPVLPRCAGTALGVERISDQLRGQFAREYGRELTSAELRSILRSYAAGKEPPDDLRRWPAGTSERRGEGAGDERGRRDRLVRLSHVGLRRAGQGGERGRAGAPHRRGRVLLRRATAECDPASSGAERARTRQRARLPGCGAAAARGRVGTPARLTMASKRFEIRWPDDAMLAELEAEARLRGVLLQQHLYDLLRARHLARHGEMTLSNLLWTPVAPAEVPPVPPINEDERAATAAAAAWGEML